MLIFLSFLKQYWKPLLIGTALVVTFYIGYYKGRAVCELKNAKVVSQAVSASFESYLDKEYELKFLDDQIDQARQKTPVDDVRDTCLLSNDPYNTQCIK